MEKIMDKFQLVKLMFCLVYTSVIYFFWVSVFRG